MKHGRRDRNHAAVRDELRALGFCVVDLGDAADGVPDLLVSKGGRWPGQFVPPPNSRGSLVEGGAWWLVEVKGRTGKLTPSQQEFVWRAQGPVCVVESAEEFLELIGGA